METNQIPNKLPITITATKEQVIEVLKEGNTLLIYEQRDNKECEIIMLVPSCIPYLNGEQFAIAAHDYRHYFGAVVDLAKFQQPEEQHGCIPFEFLSHGFNILRHDNGDYAVVSYGDYDVLPTTLDNCKQWLIDHFTAIAAKDLPNYNLKFIFS
jgi:hypothetical protein